MYGYDTDMDMDMIHLLHFPPGIVLATESTVTRSGSWINWQVGWLLAAAVEL